MPWVLQNASPLELTSVYDSVLTVLFSLILALCAVFSVFFKEYTYHLVFYLHIH